jgi:radical SAM superfamily enzyme YgiQ (UPF0313 family)
MKTLSVVICTLNSKYIHSSLAPWYLKAALESNCACNMNVHIVESTINDPLEAIAEKIVQLKPDIIGFSCYIWNIEQIKKLVKMVKKEADAVIVLGGPEVSFNAQETLASEPQVDFIICGEGEKPFAALVDAMAKQTDYTDIPGLCYRDGNDIYVKKPYETAESPPSPYSNEYMDSLNGRLAYLETSRGCPYSCAFCLSGSCGNVRFFDIDRAKNEIVKLSKSGAKTIKLIDRTFNCNPKRSYEIFEFLIENYGLAIPKGVCFHFEIAGDILDERTIRLLSTAPAGLIQFEIGLQSFNPKTLETVNRKTDINTLIGNIEKLIQPGNIHIHIDLIAGLPFEDLQSIQNSFNIAYNLKPHMLQLGFLKLLHGSTMRENPDAFPCEYSQDPPYEVIETPWLTRDELEFLHHTEDALDRLYNSGRLRRTLAYLLEQTKESPFDLISQFGVHTGNRTANIPLDDYTQLVFEYFSNRYKLDKTVLRDIMACDRLATNASGSLPAVLRVEDPSLRSRIKEWEWKNPPAKGVRRGYAYLYSEKQLVYAEYKNKHPVTGEYQLITAD